MDGAEIVSLRKAEMAAKNIAILPAIAGPMPNPKPIVDIEPQEDEGEA